MSLAILFHFLCAMWYPCYVVSVLQAEACNTDTTPTQPHRNSNTHRTKNNTTNVVLQQNSRKLLMKDILMSETCWAHKKWNKIANDIKLVFYSSTITKMHGPIDISATMLHEDVQLDPQDDSGQLPDPLELWKYLPTFRKTPPNLGN